jgi:hypothetical protein
MASEASEADKALAQLGEHARAEQKDDARFERVARGEATPDELAELEGQAETDAEIALRLEASRPLDAKVADRIAARLTAQDKPKNTASKQDKEQDKGVVVIRSGFWGSRTGRRIVVLAGPLALAAALVLFITSQRGPSGSSGSPDLPLYSVTASGEQAMRGSTEASTRLHLSKTTTKDARFEIVLRPATAPPGKVVAYAFAMGGSAATEPEALDAKIEIAPEGSVRITGPSRRLEGVREIRVVVGAPTAIGKFDDAMRWATKGSDNGDTHVRVLSVAIDRD